jgi:choline-sulfatase
MICAEPRGCFRGLSVTVQKYNLFLCALGLAAASSGCGESASRDKPSGNPDRPVVKTRAPSARSQMSTWRPLVDEAVRAELDAGGLLIDIGSGDQHKYNRGQWRSGWGDSVQDKDGTTRAAVPGRNAVLDVQPRADVVEITIRARSAVRGQRVLVYVDDKDVGVGEIGPDWGEVRIPVGDGRFKAGRRTVQVSFEKASGNGPRGEIDWIWLRSDVESPPVLPIPRVMPIPVGKRPKRALPAPSPRTYSFYLHVPAEAALVFDYGADADVEFSVRVQRDGSEPQTVFSAAAAPNTWHEGRAGLGEYAGQAVRLDLTTRGPPALAGWGEPEIMVAKAVDPAAGGQKTSPQAANKTVMPSPANAPRNLLVIVIDTVRADMFAAHNQASPAATPAYDALASQSTVFVNAYNNENWTKPSVATSLSGLYPSTHDTKRDPSVLPDAVEILPERLKREGFATAGFIANGFISDKFGFTQGWDQVRNYIRENLKSEAEYVYRDALQWLEKRGEERFFLYLQTIDPHVVYRVEERYTRPYFAGTYRGPLGPTVNGAEQAEISQGKRKASEEDYNWIKALYYGEVTYHDEHMGAFVDELRKRGILDDTLLVITNDHGEELNEHGRLGHGHSLYEELVRAPLLFHYPKLFGAGVRIEEIVEHVDLAPTLLEVLGVEPFAEADGQSLIPLIHGTPLSRPTYAISEFLDTKRSIRVGRWKMIRSASGAAELYDLVDDGGETRDRAADAPIARRLCEVYLGEGLAVPAKLARRQERSRRRKYESDNATIDKKLRQQLEALGYFGGG